MKYTVNENVPPRGNYFGGSVSAWVRGIDPFHADALPPEFRHTGNQGERERGWFGLDYWGNRITFVADGTELEDGENTLTLSMR